MSRIVPVPDTARSIHAVFTAEPVERSTDLEAPPAALLRHFGASDDALARLQKRPHARVLVLDAPTADAAELLSATRREALDLAEAHDGVAVDLAVPRIVDHAAADTSLAVAAQWVAVDVGDGVLTTRGLEAFGLPELVVHEVTHDAMAATIGVMTGLAHRLILEWPANDPVGPATVTLQDVGRGFGDVEAAAMPTDRSVDLLIAFADDTLAITLVDDPASLFS